MEDTKTKEMYNILCELLYQSDTVVRAWKAKQTLDEGFRGMGHNILVETASRFNGAIKRGLPEAIEKGDLFLKENPPPWMR